MINLNGVLGRFEQDAVFIDQPFLTSNRDMGVGVAGRLLGSL